MERLYGSDEISITKSTLSNGHGLYYILFKEQLLSYGAYTILKTAITEMCTLDIK